MSLHSRSVVSRVSVPSIVSTSALDSAVEVAEDFLAELDLRKIVYRPHKVLHTQDLLTTRHCLITCLERRVKLIDNVGVNGVLVGC